MMEHDCSTCAEAPHGFGCVGCGEEDHWRESPLSTLIDGWLGLMLGIAYRNVMSKKKEVKKMKIEIYEEKEKKEEEKIVRLKLIRCSNTVDLITVDEDGDRDESLLRISNRGIKRWKYLENTGLPVDADGRVVLDE